MRQLAFNTDPIPFQTHVKWYKNKLKSSDSIIYIAFDESDTPIGQIRFDINKQNEAEVDVSVDRLYRGRGYGTELIKFGTEKLFKEKGIRKIYAHVKAFNEASIKAFEKAGFKREGYEILHDEQTIKLSKVQINE